MTSQAITPARKSSPFFLSLIELEMCQIIWTRGEASVAQVREDYKAKKNLAYTTVLSTMQRLRRKGVIKHRKQSRAHIFSLAISKEEIANAIVDNTARIFFNGSRGELANFCVAFSARGRSEKDSPTPKGVDETLL